VMVRHSNHERKGQDANALTQMQSVQATTHGSSASPRHPFFVIHIVANQLIFAKALSFLFSFPRPLKGTAMNYTQRYIHCRRF
ncbi:MAG: hypothetical protein ACHQIM_18465, partial [Sphingobacteriales bacterium]